VWYVVNSTNKQCASSYLRPGKSISPFTLNDFSDSLPASQLGRSGRSTHKLFAAWRVEDRQVVFRVEIFLPRALTPGHLMCLTIRISTGNQ
jgi:hypothetical protein